jgi:hypothetical protein
VFYFVKVDFGGIGGLGVGNWELGIGGVPLWLVACLGHVQEESLQVEYLQLCQPTAAVPLSYSIVVSPPVETGQKIAPSLNH